MSPGLVRQILDDNLCLNCSEWFGQGQGLRKFGWILAIGTIKLSDTFSLDMIIAKGGTLFMNIEAEGL